MRESPIITLAKMPWWINLLIGLGMLSFGSLLKMDDISGMSPGKFAFGQSIQFFSIVFIGLSAVSFLLECCKGFSGKRIPQAEAVPSPPQNASPPPPPPPPPKKRKYTDRDFMPPALRAGLDAEERQTVHDQPPKPPPARGPNGGD